MRSLACIRTRPAARNNSNIAISRLLSPLTNRLELSPALAPQRGVQPKSHDDLTNRAAADPVYTVGGFGRVPIIARSQPVKSPPAPEPQKGEEPVGMFRQRYTGAEEKIYRSFVPSGGLWWFNGATPKLAPLYPSSNELPLAGYGKGTFSLKVVAGADKVGLDGNAATVSGQDLTKVTVKALAPSTKHDDVSINIKHRAPGTKTDRTDTVVLEVKAPHHLELLGTDHQPSGSYGYSSMTSLRVFDNFNEPMPFIDVNEDFGNATLEAGVSSNWKTGFDARTKGSTLSAGNAVFQDQYAIAPSAKPDPKTTPAPSNPGKPLGKTKVGSFPHDWYVGGSTTGNGVHVSHHVGVFFADHAEYTAFTSPPAAAKKPARKTP